MSRCLNFNAGPGALPLSVLQKVQGELLNYGGTGMGIMEMSHRSKEFEAVCRHADQQLRSIISIPKNYKVLFMQGGGTTQFACVPLNLLGDAFGTGTADYIVTGTWSDKAAKEAAKYCNVHLVTSAHEKRTVNGKTLAPFSYIPPVKEWKYSAKPSYVYYCANETVHGVEFPFTVQPPDGVPLVCDMSSCFCSGPIDVAKFGVIYAGAQKNVGPPGLTVVIIREDLLKIKKPKVCPTMLNYAVMAESDSLHNTPPSFSLYVTGLVFNWIAEQGGVTELLKRNTEKANLLYKTIDDSKSFYRAIVDPSCRSRMNVVFRILNADNDMEQLFVKECLKAGIVGVAGHRMVGGLRVSLYNAVDLAAVRQLCTFMQQFAKKHTKSAL